MKRDVRLRGLSSEHHRALVLARSLTEHQGAWSRADGAALGQRFDQEIEPHFRTEDELLLPALRRAGAVKLQERIAADHGFLRSQVAAARVGDGRAARAFALRLHDHVRFEERELFPVCEDLLSDEVLEAVARRSPAER